MSARHSRSDVRYWRQAIFKPVAVRDGRKTESENYAAQFYCKGRRMVLTLGTPNKDVAANKARDIFKSIDSKGWDETLADVRPKRQIAEPKSNVTIGEYIATVQANFPANPQTFEGYACCLRRIASDIANVRNRQEIGNAAWREKVEAIKLAVLTPEAIQAWKHDYLDGKSSLALKRARTSVNTTLRQCKALFSDHVPPDEEKSLLDKIRGVIELPDPVPFSKVSYAKKPSTKYKATFDVSQLSNAARTELTESDTELYKIFCLALFFGLRRNEIDKLRWSSFRWNDGEHGILRVEETEDFKAKTEESSADLPISDPSLATLFRGYQARATGRFVIESPFEPKLSSLHYHLRCEGLFSRLNHWLRAHGINGNKPLHTLRKEYGSIMNESFGIHAASTALRHTNLATTSQHYVKATVRMLPNAGLLLNGAPSNVIEMKGVA